MFRSLHMKLVLILVLMIISVMAVVGTFLINSVSTFYLDSFYEQMQGVKLSPEEAMLVRLTMDEIWGEPEGGQV